MESTNERPKELLTKKVPRQPAETWNLFRAQARLREEQANQIRKDAYNIKRKVDYYI